MDEEVPPAYLHIEHNDFSYRKHKKLEEEDVAVCECNYVADDLDSACGDRCLNVLTSTECTPGHCPCSDYCKNQRFQKRDYAKLKLVKTEGRGWGLLADEYIMAGQFIIEYCGEVISWDEARRRSQAYEAEGRTDAYIISLNAHESIDATKKGNLARFINHSCQPNCVTRKWTVMGETRVGIFSREDILVGNELAYDYNFEWYGGEKVRCLCGALCCSGFLGAKSRGFQEDTYLWEDNDGRYSIDNIPLYDSAEDEPALKQCKKLRSSSMDASNTSHLNLEDKVDLPSNIKSSVMEPPQLVEEGIMIEAKTDLNEDAKTSSQVNQQTSGQGTMPHLHRFGSCRNYRLSSLSKIGRMKLFPGGRLNSSPEEVSTELVMQLLASEEAREEVLTREEARKDATSKLESLFDEIRPTIEEHEKDSQDCVSTAVAVRWIEASCYKFKAEFDFHSSIIKHLVTASQGRRSKASGEESNQNEVN